MTTATTTRLRQAAVGAAAGGTITAGVRLTSVDTLRGIVMILMALDHVRDFFGAPGVSPTNLAQTTMPLFLTRWITHLCAPTFFLLTGTGAYLALRRKSRAELSRYLLTRGIWLIVLEVTLVRFGLQFNVDYQVTMLIVLWALGWSMIALSALVWLPLGAVLTTGAVLIAGHNLFDGIRSSHPVWVLLHTPGFLINRPEFVVFVSYPLIPWIGVTAAGFALGHAYGWPAEQRRAFLVRTGIALSLAFVVLRTANVYGDPARWSAQATTAMTVVSYLNVTKYPPSLLFLLMTLGPALLLLRALDRATPAALAPALVYGRVPLFYFLLHLPFIHLLAVMLCFWKYGDVHWMFASPDLSAYPFTPPPGWGEPLVVSYVVWVVVIAALYPVCRWYAGVKRRRDDWWLGYL